MEDPKKAMNYFKKALALNPYYAKVHVNLGSMCLKEGKFSQALMSYIMAILIEPSGSQSNSILSLMNSMVSSKLDDVKPTGIKFSEKGDDYSDIDLIISNYAALQKEYKVKSKIDIPLVRQVQVMFEQLEYDKSDGGFWMETYVPLYQKIFQEDKFEVFSYYLLRSSENSKHKKIVAKNADATSKFIGWAGDEIRDQNATKTVIINGKKESRRRFHGDGDDGLQALGKLEEGKYLGCWEFFHDFGIVSTTGCYNEEGERKGTWTWFHENGTKKEEIEFKAGKADGTDNIWNDTGTKYKEMNYKEGKLDGEYKIYHPSGHLKKLLTYKEGILEGPVTSYYTTGEKQYEYALARGKFLEI